MPKLAFVFPGQGSQAAGMGRELAAAFPAAKKIFEEADSVLGFGLSALCFEGPEEELKRTVNTQPAILTCSMAALAVLHERGWRPDYVAGHSLGEYSALVAAGGLSFAAAVGLVRNRGRYMQEAVPAGQGAMAALLGLPPEQLDPICQQAAQGQVVAPANLNSPAQVVIAGHRAAVERAVELARGAGVRKAVLLSVSAPFHCALMQPAAERLARELDAMEFRDLETALINNFAAREIRTGVEARESLKQQVVHPVRWEQSMRYLIAQGVEHFVEVGPGKVLTGLLRNIDRSPKASNVEDLESLEKLSL